MGQQVHFALQILYKNLMHSKNLYLDDLIEIYKERWDREWEANKEHILVVNRDYKPEHFKETGIMCIKQYWKHYCPFNSDITLGLERKIRFPIDKAHWIEGRIDRLAKKGDTIEIHDYKTSQYLPSQYRLANELQLGLYAFGVQREWNLHKPIYCVWHYLIQDHEMRVAQTPQATERAKAMALELIHKIESSIEFEPKESILCDWCEFQSYCPKRKHIASLQEVEPAEFAEDEGVKLVDEWVRLWNAKGKNSKELERTKEKILRYTLQNGLENVENGSFRIGIKWRTFLDLPSEESDSYKQLVNLLKSSEYWNDVSALDERALRHAIQEDKLPQELKNKILKLAPLRKEGVLADPKRVSG
jgi:hypothetical protein